MKKESGFALMLTLISLTILTVLGLSLSFNALTDKRISNNHEAEILANQLAEAGLNRALLELRGKAFNTIVVGGTTYTQVLIGPNNQQDTLTSTVTANGFDFRNPIPMKGLRVVDPRLVDIGNLTQITSATVNDDGVIGTIGQTGVGYYVNPGNDGIFGTSDDVGFFDNTRLPTAADQLMGRYLVKVTNNPEDPGGPFRDTDYTLVIRSTGIAKSMRGETAIGSGGSATNIRNSVVTVEARIRLDTTFQTNSPFTIQGSSVVPAGNNFFDGNAYRIDGGNYLGMSVIDTSQPYNTAPIADPMVNAICGAAFSGNTVGAGLQMGPACDAGGDNASIRNITGNVLNGQTWSGAPNPDVTNVLNPAYVGNLIFTKVPGVSDQVYNGATGCEAFQGDINNPKLVYVCGDLTCAGNSTGAGLMVVTGSIVLTGNVSYSGMILAIGGGSVQVVRGTPSISGGIWSSKISCLPGGVCGTGNGCAFGQASFTLRGNIGGVSNTDYLNMALSLLPFNVIGNRKIQTEMEP